MGSLLRAQYEQLVSRFRAFVEGAVAHDATVIVVSKGDHALLNLDVGDSWHFPQRADGVYAGYYPSDSSAAIAHLESLRGKGADVLAFPWSSLWWLDHYEEFRRHLETRYRELARDDETGVLYALSDAATRRYVWSSSDSDGSAGRTVGDDAPREGVEVTPPDEEGARSSRILEQRTAARRSLNAYVDDDILDDARALFDPLFYGERTGMEFRSPDDALVHYVETGYRHGVNPHPLFDTRWYMSRNPDVRITGANPLLHFVRHGTADELEPNPYFDTAYYYAQRPALRERGGNALVHYLQDASAREAAIPNPLFSDRYYLRTYPDVRAEAGTPLEHFLLIGLDEGRFGSHVHRNMVLQSHRSSTALSRGRWRKGTVLFFTRGERRDRRVSMAEMAERLGANYHVGSLVVAYGGERLGEASHGHGPDLVLEDYELACEIFRPSALRFLALSLTSARPLFAVLDVEEVLEPLRARDVGTYFVLPDIEELSPPETLHRVFAHAHRVLLPSSAVFHAVRERLGRYPTNVSLQPPTAGPGPGRLGESPGDEYQESPGESYSQALVELAQSDLGADMVAHPPTGRRVGSEPRKILIPCSDWSVSGVNASLEAVGTELIKCGWDVEIVFTRAEATVLETAHGKEYLPQLPYRFLPREKPGIIGMWEALIAELEASTPCVLFTAYDFLANSVVPALTDGVGVVAWAQADDGDYYEQAYRLGRYCNAIVCVSQQIKDQVAALNPLIGERAHVIHNSSIRRHEVAKRRPRRGNMMRIAYCGRLVQYQKRVLDFIPLARALDATGVPYEISLIGTFSPREKTDEAFQALAREHLEDGRVRLRGRMARADILEELTSHDFFVLLSDFEGLPLSLVEAMARGCVPVVAESPSGIPELVDSGDNGLIVSGRDYDAWAALLVEVWRNGRGRSAMSRRARAKVRAQFTVEHVAYEFDELFRRVAAEVAAGSYRRPPSLNWGPERTQTGDVLPPPNLHRPAALQIAGLH